MSGILENRSSGLIQFVPGFAVWVEKEGVMKEALRVPTTVSPLLEPQLESVPANGLRSRIRSLFYQFKRILRYR